MWEQYQPPGEESEQPPAQRATRRPPIVASGMRSRGAGAVVGVVATAVIAVGSIAIGSSDPEPDYSGFYDCVAEKKAGEPGLVSPAVICEIGNERPPDYYDDHEYDPFEDGGR
jgi:hypothetical protein